MLKVSFGTQCLVTATKLVQCWGNKRWMGSAELLNGEFSIRLLLLAGANRLDQEFKSSKRFQSSSWPRTWALYPIGNRNRSPTLVVNDFDQHGICIIYSKIMLHTTQCLGAMRPVCAKPTVLRTRSTSVRVVVQSASKEMAVEKSAGVTRRVTHIAANSFAK